MPELSWKVGNQNSSMDRQIMHAIYATVNMQIELQQFVYNAFYKSFKKEIANTYGANNTNQIG